MSDAKESDRPSKVVALVTGASQGLGAVMARRLAEKGCFVIVDYAHGAAKAEAVAADIRANGGEAVAYRLDVSDEAAVQAAFAEFEAKYGGVHVLDRNVAFTRGPILLARDSRFADGDLTEPFRRGLKDAQVMPTFSAVRSPSDDIWMTFAATLPIGSHHENPEGALHESVTFCDYASAGNTWRRDDYYRTWFPIELGPTD